MTAAALHPRLQEIAEDFTGVPGQDRLQLLLEYSQDLPDLPERYAGQHDLLEPVPECQSPLFLAVEVEPDSTVHLFFDAPPESPTTRGFAAILHAGLDGLTADEVLATPAEFSAQLGLQDLVSPLRLRGMAAMLARIKHQIRDSGGDRSRAAELRFSCLCSWEGAVTAGPGYQGAAADRGRLRASHADRERVVEALKAAFVQGRLTKDELDERLGQAFASRTYAELAAVTADIPLAQLLRAPARARARPMNNAVKAAICLVIAATMLVASYFAGGYEFHVCVACYFVALVMAAVQILHVRRGKRSRGTVRAP